MPPVLSSPTAPAVVEQVSSDPSRDEVVLAIKEEALVSTKVARRFIDWIDNVADIMRTRKMNTHYLTDDELARYHDVMDAVMEDDQPPVKNSAHDLIERYVLDPSLDEYGLRHSRSTDIVGSPTYCTVQLQLNII